MDGEDVNWELNDILTLDLRGRRKLLLESLPPNSNFARSVHGISSATDLLSLLPHLLADPSLTLLVATHFRPIILDICARWLDYSDDKLNKMAAFGNLIELHEEIYPIMYNFLENQMEGGPLAYLSNASLSDLDGRQLHAVLLAYYRILRACPTTAWNLCWDCASLVAVFEDLPVDLGSRWLAIRCYAMQMRMGESERVKLEKRILGEIGVADCNVWVGQNVMGVDVFVDGWLLPMIEVKRIQDQRRSFCEPQSYFQNTHAYMNNSEAWMLCASDLNHRIVNVSGILCFVPHKQSHLDRSSEFIQIPSSMMALRKLALHWSLQLPTLLTSAPSAGKLTTLRQLATLLHLDPNKQIIIIYLADTSLDPRSLLGTYISSTKNPGSFEWQDGILVRAMSEGRWIILKDIDRANSDVLSLIAPLIESLTGPRKIGMRASLDVPGRGTIEATTNFALFATSSVQTQMHSLSTTNPPSHKFTFLNNHKWSELFIPSPTVEELSIIILTRFPKLRHISQGIISLWQGVKDLGSQSSSRAIGIRDLQKFCQRLSSLTPRGHDSIKISEASTSRQMLSIISDPLLKEEIFLESRDVFFGGGTAASTSQAHYDVVSILVAEHLGLPVERCRWLLNGRVAEFELERDSVGRIQSVLSGRTRLPAHPEARPSSDDKLGTYAMHKPAKNLMARIATCVTFGEPVLLTGETGTGKTSVVSHLARLLNQPLTSLNLSTQTESSDIIGGMKPLDIRVPGLQLQQRFISLFDRTFSLKKNFRYQEDVHKAIHGSKWKRVVKLWKEAARLAKDKLRPSIENSAVQEHEQPRKRQKTKSEGPFIEWDSFENDVQKFDIQHVLGGGKPTFAFIEGPLIRALTSGTWILLDEINLAGAETLECISSILHHSKGSIVLPESGSLEPIQRHPNFRLFACMNPATDVGKKDLPAYVRSHFTEIDVLPPDADQESLLSIVKKYIGHCTMRDPSVILDVAEFYTSVKKLAGEHVLADGSNHRPHFSMRTLVRALVFTSDLVHLYGLRRTLWEGCLMAFTMALNTASASLVNALARKHVLRGVKNPDTFLMITPPPPPSTEGLVPIGPFWLQTGPLEVSSVEEYVLTPSVQKKLLDLSRIIVTGRFPVLIEGPTSSGKTSAVEYLAKRTGHRFVRINNHEHTDIQEYLGTYHTDLDSGKLVYRDGLLVRALRSGDWIVLDELNLAPTDVLEALNRLLDDNRELVVPETQEVIRPHPRFMLFATQNPPGVYAGRKVLSRALRNRFLEVHFEDVPESELETILCQRCRIAPSYGHAIIKVFRELQSRRQTDRLFEGKQSFVTLRDLFRWAGRDAVGYQELAEDGYMLLAERTRRLDDKAMAKEVIEAVMKVKIDDEQLYNLRDKEVDWNHRLACSVPFEDNVVWTKSMQRLFILVARALRFNEPVLLVGETGSGKTSVCQLYANSLNRRLRALNCHQNMEASDLIGGYRPVRKENLPTSSDFILTEDNPRSGESRHTMNFQWYNGALVDAMKSGEVFLLDEISLADDSVLERLNSVLELQRSIVLAERGDSDEESHIIADESFKFISTMNPGGDYGKKELSPALRNRFTEIWVPAITDRADFLEIVMNSWKHHELVQMTQPLLDFVDWFRFRVRDSSIATLRDILAWVTFCNTCYGSQLSLKQIFHHAASLSFIDGLPAFSQLSGWSTTSLSILRQEALQQLDGLSSSLGMASLIPVTKPVRVQFILGDFGIKSGGSLVKDQTFNLKTPTSRSNAEKVLRACQLDKPILLEGSPGVGKSSLIAALAAASGHTLRRVNLSDQTDLSDLFGSDLPVAGGQIGEFQWRNAVFLQALQCGEWILLDEMNLAPQSVLEGLNAVLDHRGAVYIPELDRTFTRHPNFRIFAAQNPLHQGGGRKGLPKSFVNRFTKVYIDPLSASDMTLICQHVFPSIPIPLVESMVEFNTRLHEEVVTRRSFGHQGSPWEFNLRDLMRWATLTQDNKATTAQWHPEDFVDTVYAQRFRSQEDRLSVHRIFRDVFRLDPSTCSRPWPSISPNHFQVGRSMSKRGNFSETTDATRLLPWQLPGMEATLLSCAQNWLVILCGSKGSGKTNLVRTCAHLCGQELREVHLGSGTDTTDLLGSYEQVEQSQSVRSLLCDILGIFEQCCRIEANAKLSSLLQIHKLRRISSDHHIALTRDNLRFIRELIEEVPRGVFFEFDSLRPLLNSLLSMGSSKAAFEWRDGPLVHAMKTGQWLLLENANSANASVLDRLNSLCEAGGTLSLDEKGEGSEVLRPHPAFKIFMTVDPHMGELSRAMRNRGIEIYLNDSIDQISILHILDAYRLPCLAVPSPQLPRITFNILRRAIAAEIPVAFQNTSDCSTNELVLVDSLNSCGYDYVSFLASTIHSCSDQTMELFGIRSFPFQSEYPHFGLRLLNWCSLGDHFGFQKATFQNMHDVIKDAELSRANLVHKYYHDTLGQMENLKLQPLDFFLNPIAYLEQRRCYSGHERILKDVIDLWVTSSQVATILGTLKTALSKTGSVTAISGSFHNVNESRVREIYNFFQSYQSSVGKLTEASEPLDRDQYASSIRLTHQTLKMAIRLIKEDDGLHFDFSTAHALMTWIVNLLEDSPAFLSELKERALALRSVTSLSSGLGLLSIWSGYFHPQLPPIYHEVLSHAELLHDPFVSERHRMLLSLRMRALEFLSVASFPESKSLIDSTAVQLKTDLSSALNSVRQLADEIREGEGFLPFTEPYSTVLKLGLISTFNPMSTAPLSSGFMHEFQRLLHISMQTPKPSFALHLAHQRLQWHTEAQHGIIPDLARMQLEWIMASDAPLTVKNSDVELFPVAGCVALISITQFCSENRSSSILAYMDNFKSSLNDHIAMTSMETLRTSSRPQELFTFALQNLLTLCATCQQDLDESALQELRIINCNSPSGFINCSSALTEVFLRCAPSPFTYVLNSTVIPALQSLEKINLEEGEYLQALGKLFLSIAHALLVHYIPDVPLDPDIVSRCREDFWKDQEQSILSEIDILAKYSMHHTGRSLLPEAEALALELAKAKTEASKHTHSQQLRRESNILELSHFWSEVQQFTSEVVSIPALQDVLDYVARRGANRAARLRVIYDSISGFQRRMSGSYRSYDDLLFPVSLALAQIKFGLKLFSHSVVAASSLPIPKHLAMVLEFPDIRVATYWASRSVHSINLPDGYSKVEILLLQLGGLGLNTFQGASLPINAIHEVYECIYTMWTSDRQRVLEEEKKSQSLYKTREYAPDPEEGDNEEEEVRALFPTFDEDPEDTTHLQRRPSNLNHDIALSPALNATLWELHKSLFVKDSGVSPDTKFHWRRLRCNLASAFVQDQRFVLPVQTDQSSLPYRIRMLYDANLKLRDPYDDDTYNFYADPNVAEMSASLKVIGDLGTRLDSLIREWPDQMVLSSLRQRCHRLLSLPMTTCVARMLVELEALLAHTEDWESFANRDNSLADHRQAITTLIVDWRRKELASWRKILAVESRQFASNASEWWFRVYDISINALLSSASDPSASVDEYLDQLVPLINDFLVSGPIGEFVTRMDLIQSFHIYLAELSNHFTGPPSQALMRTSRVLGSLHSFYARRKEGILSAFSDSTRSIHVEVEGLIKIAAWKDTTVLSLRESARRTHYQLYKSIRKFRAALRQPVTGFLNLQKIPTIPDHPSTVVAPRRSMSETSSFPPRGGDSPLHLQDIQLIFSKYKSLFIDDFAALCTSSFSEELESLANSVITTSEKLSKTSVPSSLSAAQQEKWNKALLVRKQRAWSDLLKELKNLGFTSNLKPEVLRTQTNKRFLLEQINLLSLLEHDAKGVLEKGECYFDSSLVMMPLIRIAPVEHSEDITTRDLQRGINLVESIYSYALRSRQQLGDVLETRSCLSRFITRLSEIMRSSRSPIAKYLRETVDTVYSTICRSLDALGDLCDSIEKDHVLLQKEGSPPISLMGKLHELMSTMQQMKDDTFHTLESMGLTECCIILPGEAEQLNKSQGLYMEIIQGLSLLEEQHHDVRYLIEPVRSWFDSLKEIFSPVQSFTEKKISSIASYDLIDNLLVVAQDLRSLSAEIGVEENENVVRTSVAHLERIRRCLKLHIVMKQLNTFIIDATGSLTIVDEISRLQPFLDTYAAFVDKYIFALAQHNKSLFKFVHVFSTVIRTIAVQGFCKPPPAGEDDAAGTDQMENGTGFGSGTANQDKSGTADEQDNLEGLQGEEKQEGADDTEAIDDAIEMDEEYTGAAEDFLGQEEDEEDRESGDEEEEEEMDQEFGQNDGLDENQVDEAFWNSKEDKESAENDKPDSGTDAREVDPLQKPTIGEDNPEAAQEPEESKQDVDVKSSTEIEAEHAQDNDVDAGSNDGDQQHSQEDPSLPDDMHFDEDPAAEEAEDGKEEAGSQFDADEIEVDNSDDALGEDIKEGQNELEPDQDDSADHNDTNEDLDSNNLDTQRSVADVDAGDGQGDSMGVHDNRPSEAAKPMPEDDPSRQTSRPPEPTATTQTDTLHTSMQPDDGNDGKGDGQPTLTNHSSQMQDRTADDDPSTLPNPLKNLAESLREIQRRYDNIRQASNQRFPQPQPQHDDLQKQDHAIVEHVPEDVQESLEALGPAEDQQAAQLSKLHISDRDTAQFDENAMDVEEPAEKIQLPEVLNSSSQTQDTEEPSAEEKNAPRPQKQELKAEENMDVDTVNDLPTINAASEKSVEPKITPKATLQSPALENILSQDPEQIWQSCEHLTHSLSYTLCEQLRLILEPSKATRLKGDYRTGKRLNMRKIIPYIASDYTKDKIWLRRKKPSQREYQVLIVLDDSKSMAESHAVWLTWQSLALVVRALDLLDVGDVAVGKFGREMEVLHSFSDGKLTSRGGIELVKALRFDQDATDTLAMLESSLELLEASRREASASSSSAGDLWQLEIIISDGLCQDHEKLRALLRKAEEMKVLVVFIVVDAIRTSVDKDREASGSSENKKPAASSTSSILNMNQVTYQMVNGQLEIQMARYLDTFPFTYFAVIRDVESLPDVLSGILKQFFERISEE